MPGNDNGYAESRRMVLGVGDIYMNGTFVGNLKGKVELHIKRTYAYQRAGNNIADQKAEVTGEDITLDAEICDLKLSQLRTAFGVTQAVDIVTAKSVLKREVLTLTGIVSTALGSVQVVDATHPFKVSSLDRKKVYTSGTDYKLSGTGFERVSGGAIVDGQTVIAEYYFSNAAAQSLGMGGETKTPATFRMDYVVRDDTGKAWQVSFFKAIADTDFKMIFQDRHSGNFTTHNVSFRALVDTTRVEGANTMEIVQEDAAV